MHIIGHGAARSRRLSAGTCVVGEERLQIRATAPVSLRVREIGEQTHGRLQQQRSYLSTQHVQLTRSRRAPRNFQLMFRELTVQPSRFDLDLSSLQRPAKTPDCQSPDWHTPMKRRCDSEMAQTIDGGLSPVQDHTHGGFDASTAKRVTRPDVVCEVWQLCGSAHCLRCKLTPARPMDFGSSMSF